MKTRCVSTSFWSAVVLTFLLASMPAAWSQTVNAWTNPASGLWHSPANWSAGAAPLFTNSFVTITNFNSKVITADANTPATNLYLRNLTIWAFQNRQNTLVLTNLAARLEVTRGLTMSNGAALLAYRSDVVVDGALGGELSLTAAHAALTGSSITLTNGALMKIGNGPGSASVSLTNGTLRAGADLRVGALNRSSARLTLNGGAVQIGNEFTVADATGSTGAVVVLQGQLQALNTNFNARIGQRGVGSLVVSNGQARFDDVSIGRQDGGRGDLLVAGGDFLCGTLSIGRFSNSVGQVTVAGGHVDVASGSLYAGREGTGTLTQSGGLVTASRLLVSGPTNTASGSVQISGGAAVFSSAVNVGSPEAAGQLQISGGLLACTNAGGTGTVTVVRGALTLSGGRLEADRLILTNAAGPLQWTAGTLRVGDLIVDHGAPFVVGDGVQPAFLELHGSATFTHGLVLSANASLIGCGQITGQVTVQAGGSNLLQPCSTGVTPILLAQPTAVPGGIQFSFNTDPGVRYTVEFTDDLGTPIWQTLQTLTGTGAAAVVTDPLAVVNRRFYRVRTP